MIPFLLVGMFTFFFVLSISNLDPKIFNIQGIKYLNVCAIALTN